MSDAVSEATIETWLVQVMEWNGAEYVERIVGAFPNEEEAEVWAERHLNLAPSVFDALHPVDADALYATPATPDPEGAQQ